MSQAVVDVRQVFCVHRTDEGDAAALQGMDLRIERGELVSVVGPSGAGKSTLLRVIAGLERPSAGIVSVLGRDIGRLRSRERSRIRHEQIGFVGQQLDASLPPDLPIAQAIELPLMLRGAEQRVRRMRVQELLDIVGLRDRARALPEELSGGERQRVALCAAVAHRPSLLLADEPTGELDDHNAEAIRGLIAQLARAEQTSALIVSHDPTMASIADRAVGIRDGRAVELHSDVARKPVNGPNESTPLPPADSIAVEVQNISRALGRGRTRRAVFDGFDSGFKPGALTVITGRSGAGKTTLLRLIAGLDRADAGDVLVDGASLGALTVEARAALRRARIGYLPQEPTPVRFLSAEENVILALRIRGWTRADAAARAAVVLAGVGLADRERQLVSRLSAGEAQRVALARALAAARGLLIADEPTSRLDELSARALAALLASAARDAHQTVICASHDPELIACADHVVALTAASPAVA